MGMKKRWLGGAVIGLGALALAASASAECAWVLWDPAGGRWDPVQAFKSQRECLANAPPGTRCLPDTVDPRGPRSR